MEENNIENKTKKHVYFKPKYLLVICLLGYSIIRLILVLPSFNPTMKIFDDPPIILSMKDLGFDDSIVDGVDLRSYLDGSIEYTLLIENKEHTPDDTYQPIRIRLFSSEDKEKSKKRLIKRMSRIKGNERRWIAQCTYYCISLVDYEKIDIDKDFYKLDINEWQVDEAYALHDYYNYPEKNSLKTMFFY